MISAAALEILVWIGVGACALSPIVLVMLLVKDLKEKSLW